MQPSDLRDSMRSFNKQPSYSTISVRVKSPKQIEAVEQAIKKLGFNTFSILDATRSLRQFFAVLDLFLAGARGLALSDLEYKEVGHMKIARTQPEHRFSKVA